MIKVIRITAEWCRPCSVLAPLIEELKNENPDVVFETIDVDENPDALSLYGIRGVPVVIVKNNDTETARFVGVHSKNVYETAINNQRSN